MGLKVRNNCDIYVNSDGIYNYMKKQTGPDSVHLKTKEDLQTFVNNYDASIVGMTDDKPSDFATFHWCHLCAVMALIIFADPPHTLWWSAHIFYE